jgi:hypothetical protein
MQYAMGVDIINDYNHANHTPLHIAIKKKCFFAVLDLFELSEKYGMKIDTSKLCGKSQLPIFFLLC